MSKNRNPQSGDAMVRPPVVVLPEIAPTRPPAAAELKFDFGHTRRCPKCGSTNSRLDGVRGRYGHRQCQNVHCRRRWKVLGRQI